MGNEIRTFANIDLNNEIPLGQCILFLWKIVHAATQLTWYCLSFSEKQLNQTS